MNKRLLTPTTDKHEYDQALLYAAQNGDRQAAIRLIRALGPNAHALAWRMVNNTAEAQDIVQDAFIKLLKTARYEGRSSLSTFFYAIVSNACLDALRKKNTEPLDEDEFEAKSISADAEPGQLLALKQQAATLQSALIKLSPRQRIAISLWAYNDASILDIANTLEIEINAANQLLHRAKVNLKTLLKEKP
jgi:RNA polymerase sigma-70 factor, ECF subfamily